MRIGSFSPIGVALPQRSAAPVQTEAGSGTDSIKSRLIESMIRVAPHEEARRALVEALSFMPTEALARVAEFGTRLEVYDKRQPDLPLYAKHLSKEGLAGAYSPTANVVFVDHNNITPLVLLHELSHALDAALGDPSQADPWTGARDTARASRVCIRPYATHNSAEYFADNLAAHLIPDSELPRRLAHDLKNGVATAGLSKEQFLGNHIHYSHERQRKADPTAYRLVADLLRRLPELPAAPSRPALTPDEYRAVKVAQLRAMKAAAAA